MFRRISYSSVFIFLIFCLASTNSPAQYYSSGEDPSSVKWNEIETRYFKLVYDRQFEDEAQKIASYLDYSIEFTGDYHFLPIKKMPVIVHNHSIISNGMVAWAPRRMELYTVPPQDMYAHGWFEQLAIHEGRHVTQMYRLHQGVTRVLSYILGEQGAAISIAQTHAWFLEGDAVVAETALSNSGRGRLPSFKMGYRSILLENDGRYSFRKAVFGSYKDYVPNHYELGYMMVAYNRSKYSPQLWNSTIDRIAKRGIFALNPFNRGVKKYTGFNRNQLYNNTFDYYSDYWKQQADSLNYTSHILVNRRKSDSYISYLSPQVYESKIYTLKKSIDDVPRIVVIDPETGKESKVHTPGSILSDRIQLVKGKIYWDEYKGDIRWPQRSFSEIKIFDIGTGERRTLTRKTRYSAPAVSPDGKMIAVTESDVSGKNFLVILNEADGQELHSVAVPLNAAIQLPSWNQGSDRIIMTQVNEAGKSLLEYNLKSRSWKQIGDMAHTFLSSPVYYKNKIIYQASYSGIDNIYSFDTLTSEIAQLTSVKQGAFYPSIPANTDSLYFSNYTSKGHDLVFMGLDSKKTIFLTEVKKLHDPIAQDIALQEAKKFNHKNIEHKKFDSRPYNKASHLFNFHSWAPAYLYNNPEGPTRSVSMPGITAMSQNLQNTLFISGGTGIYYNRSFSSVDVTYRGFFPVFSASMFYGDSINYINDRSSIASKARLFQFDGRVSVPLSFSEGNTNISLEPAFVYRYENRYYYIGENMANRGLNKYAVQLTFKAQKRVTQKHLAPRLGLLAYLKYQAPFSNIYFSPSRMMVAQVFLPGILQHHSIKLETDIESHNLNRLFNPSMIGSIRGFEGRMTYELGHLENMNVYSVDYMMPLLYPDITLFRVLYFKRIKSTLFYDHAFAKIYNNENYTFYNKNFFSKGIDITTDFHLFFFPAEINMGCRLSFINNENKLVSEFLFGVNL